MNKTTVLSINIPVEPVPKSRPRVSKGRAYTPKRTKNAEAMIATYVRAKYKGKVHLGAMGIKLVFVHKRPKNLKGTARKLKATLPDGDNLLKLVLDSCQGIVYKNDGQFCVFHILDYYASKDESPHIEAIFSTICED